jgi:hypothetical protein
MKTKNVVGRGAARSTLALSALALSQILGGCAADVDDPSAEHADQAASEDQGAQETDTNEKTSEPWAQYRVADVDMGGYSVSFYELEPGSLLELERGDVDAHIAEPPGLDSVQRYEYLSGQKAPAELVAAMERAGGEGHTDEPVPARLAQQKGVGNSTPDWFFDNYCRKTDRYFGSTVRNSFYTNTNGPSFRAGVEYLRGGVYVYWGELSYRQGYSGGNIPDQWYGLHSGQYAAWRNTSRVDRTASSKVENALGWDNGNSVYGTTDKYYHCLNYHY